MTPYEFFTDESGSFERETKQQQTPHRKPCRIVGGVVVPEGLAVRREELRQPLLELGRRFFPDITAVTDIHLKDIEDQSKRSDLRNQLISFWKSNMAGAKIAIVYGHEDLDVENSPPGAHLYRNMLISLLRSVIYFHPLDTTGASFNINLAHREATFPEGFDNDLSAQGYLRLREFRGKTFYTAISRADLESILMNLRDSQRIRVERSAQFAMKTYRVWNDPFMVMADLICNTMLGIAGKKNDADVLGEVRARFGRDSVLYVASTEYDFPETILTLAMQNRPAECIDAYYRSLRSRKESDAATDSLILTSAVERALAALASRVDLDLSECTLIVNLMLDIYDLRQRTLYGQVSRLIDALAGRFTALLTTPSGDAAWDRTAYLYFNATLIRANHSGDFINGPILAQHAVTLYNRLRSKTVEDVRAHNRFLNRSTVIDSNEFAFDRAIVKLLPVMDSEKKLTSLLGVDVNENLGRIYGSLGQNYAFAGDYSKAKDCFQKAKIHLGSHDTMQTSYLAHLACDNGDSGLYEREVALLFFTELSGAAFPGFRRLLDICLSDTQNYAFNLHLVLKGLMVFDRSTDRLKLLVATDRTLSGQANSDNSYKHPWQLIFTVMGDLSADLGDWRIAVGSWEKASHLAGNSSEITLIMHGHAARASLARYLFEIKKDLVAATQLVNEIAKTFRDLHANRKGLGIFNPDHHADPDGVIRKGWFDAEGIFFLQTPPLPPNLLLDALQKFKRKFTFNYW